MIKPYNRKVPALLQSRTNISDTMTINVSREFVEGWVLREEYYSRIPLSQLTVFTDKPQSGDYIQVRLYDSK
jgi:hypothetical protein